MTAFPFRVGPLSFVGLVIFHLLSLPLVTSQTPSLPATSDPESAPSLPEECRRKMHPVTSYTALTPWLSSFSLPGVNDYSPLALDLTRNQLIVGARNHLFRLSLSNVSLLQRTLLLNPLNVQRNPEKGDALEADLTRICQNPATEWGVDESTRRSCQSKGKTEDECQNYVRVLLLNGSRLFTCGTNAFMPICTTRPITDVSSVLESISGVARCPYDPRHNSTAMITESGEVYAATVTDFSSRDPIIYRSLGNMPPLRTAQYNSKWLNEPHFVSAYEVGRFTYLFLRENAVEQDCGKTVFSRVARVCQNDIGGRFLLEDTWTTFMKARLNCSRSGDVPFYYHELQSTFYLPEQDLIYGVFTTNVNSIAASAVCAFNLSAVTQAFNGPFRYQENPRTSWLSTPNPIPNFQCGTVNDSGPGGNLTERSLQDAQRLFLMSEVVQPISTDPLVMQDNIRFSRLAVDIVQGRDTLYHVMYIGTEYGTIIKALSTTNSSLHGCYLEEMNILPENMQEPILNLQILHSDRSLFVGLPSRERNLTQDGGFGQWSPWQACNHDDGGEGTSTCQCRTRACDNPRPQCGGMKCVGANIEVANCSRLCNEKNLCPVPVSWVSWSAWSKCSVACGGGVQSRVRTCENGNTCPGCPLEYKACNLDACAEVRRTTPWTPWYPVNVTQMGARQEQRVRYTCRALLADPHDLQLGKRKIETRLCPTSDGAAACETDGAAWSSWETWSTCSKECSKGFRTRKRSCATPDGKSTPFACSGAPVEYQDCNIQPCPVKGAWSCWSSWSQCSTSCGGGHYQRSRTCSNPSPAHSGDICIGLHTEEALCNTHECEGGWGAWSEWAECNEEGLQLRTRTCETSSASCQGNSTDQRQCRPNESAVLSKGQKRSTNCGGFSLFHLVLTGACCFLGAVLLSVLVYVYCQRLRKPPQESAVIHPSTPNHLHYKENSCAPKNDLYTPMEFKTLNKNNLLPPDESCNFFPSALPQTNVYATTYYPSPLGKYDYPSMDSPCSYMHS
ncbi:Semaphorin-5B [Labeo rohita]|uniref:Semaphorin-5B n=1 Tax=Labeo rohita TaxID=84645 RepID=A0ABQ8MK42_LABRO|nr:Semaphorin-5B [Labeo rohita]